MTRGTLEAMSPGAFAAQRPAVEELEQRGWHFSANRTARGLVYVAEGHERGALVRRFDPSLRHLLSRCNSDPRGAI